MAPPNDDDLAGADRPESLDAYIELQREAARRLAAELPGLSERLGAARRAQEHLQRPSTNVTEVGRRNADLWYDRARRRLKRS